MEKKEDHSQLVLFADVIPIGGGQYKLVAQKPFGAELTPRQAARFLGVSRPTIYRLLDFQLIVHRRPSPRKILIDLESLKSHREKSKDSEFWQSSKISSQASLFSQAS